MVAVAVAYAFGGRLVEVGADGHGLRAALVVADGAVPAAPLPGPSVPAGRPRGGP